MRKVSIWISPRSADQRCRCGRSAVRHQLRRNAEARRRSTHRRRCASRRYTASACAAAASAGAAPAVRMPVSSAPLRFWKDFTAAIERSPNSSDDAVVIAGPDQVALDREAFGQRNRLIGGHGRLRRAHSGRPSAAFFRLLGFALRGLSLLDFAAACLAAAVFRLLLAPALARPRRPARQGDIPEWPRARSLINPTSCYEPCET